MSILESILHVLNDGSLPVWPRILIAIIGGFIAGWVAARMYYHVQEMKDQLSKLDFANPIIDPDRGLVDEEGHQLCPRCWKKHIKARLCGFPPYCTLCHYDSNKDGL